MRYEIVPLTFTTYAVVDSATGQIMCSGVELEAARMAALMLQSLHP